MIKVTDEIIALHILFPPDEQFHNPSLPYLSTGIVSLDTGNAMVEWVTALRLLQDSRGLVARVPAILWEVGQGIRS